MPKFLILASYTSEAWNKMIQDPPDRPGAAGQLAEALGGGMECFYFAFGEFDIVTILDLPDDAAAAAVSLAVTSSGRVKSIRTHRLIAADEAPDMFAKAKTAVATYQVPGG